MKTTKQIIPCLLAAMAFTACSTFEDHHAYDYNKYAKWVDAVDIEAKDIPNCFGWNNIEYDYVMFVNWEDYQYKPHTECAIAYTDSSILLHFLAKESKIRAFRSTNMDSVWTDACVAFFFEPNKDGNYYALFANCTGHLYMDFGRDTTERDHSTLENIEQIKCWASLGSQAHPTVIEEETQWELAINIPFKAFWRHEINTVSGLKAKANFYKCCTEGENEHYVTWRPIDTPKPEFYRSEYFKEIIFSEK